MEKLLEPLCAIKVLSPDLRKHLLDNVEYLLLPEGTFLLKAGCVSDYIYFIVSGLTMSYYFKGEIKVASWFNKENDFCMSVLSFLRREPSRENIVVLEDCFAYRIHYDKLQHIYEYYSEFNLHGRKLTERYYAAHVEWNEKVKMQGSEERLKAMSEIWPHLLLNKKYDKYTSSFLDMSTRSFSRYVKNYRPTKYRKPKKRKK